MNQDDLNEFGEDDDFSGQTRENRNIRQLREKAKEADNLKGELTKAQDEARTARRELAFLKAGIDTESNVGKLFAKAYDGDTSLDAVKAAAAEYGLIKADEPSEEEIAQQQALQRLAGAAQGAAGPGAAQSVITPSDFSSWDTHKRRTFLAEHRAAAEALKRGQSVPAIPGF